MPHYTIKVSNCPGTAAAAQFVYGNLLHQMPMRARTYKTCIYISSYYVKINIKIDSPQSVLRVCGRVAVVGRVCAHTRMRLIDFADVIYERGEHVSRPAGRVCVCVCRNRHRQRGWCACAAPNLWCTRKTIAIASGSRVDCNR